MDWEIVEKPPTLPPRPAEGNKGTFGRLLVVAGNETMIGAPALAGLSALRMGAGLVQVATPKASLLAVLSIAPELIGLALPRTGGMRELLKAADDADALVVGPGLGQSPEAAVRVHQLLAVKRPMVLDADALNILSKGKKWPRSVAATAVLTPHPGEMKRLGKLIDVDEIPTDDDGRANVAIKAATAFGQVVLLKGHRTVVTDGRQVYFNTTGNSALAKAGTGDVLSGMIGALLAGGMPPFAAACCAAHLHGFAGEIAGEEQGLRSVLAREVIDAIPIAIDEEEN
jgi:NAD(P)H-hydrate epimerase